MKLKLSELTLLFFALVFAVGAVLVKQIEPAKETSYTETAEQREPPEEFFVTEQTVDPSTIQSNSPQSAQENVENFFTLFQSLNSNTPQTQNLSQIRALMSEKLNNDIRPEEPNAIRDISRIVGLLNSPQKVTILRAEQTSAETIDVLAEVTTEDNQTIVKRISTINENNTWKIDSFTIVE